MHSLQQALDRGQSENTAVGVLFLDLDRFKMVNDSMGHETGDLLLTLVAERLLDSVRTTDSVARFGGDEFIVICSGLMNESAISAMATDILAAFEKPLIIDGGEFVVTPSIGVAASSPDHPRLASDLLRDVDAAMYRAKRSKSGHAVYDEAQRRNAISRIQTERALRTALDNSDLEVFYQPIVDGNTRTLRELEALVRWRRPDKGLVSPDQFLPVAEEAGLMSALGELVMREACAQSALWNHGALTGSRIGMAVNVAERQLIDKNFPSLVARVLQWSGLTPSQLILEITEDLVVDHLDSSLSVLRDLKSLGVALSIDDFGTGRSSLSYIKRLDMVDSLKIDRSFVSDLGHSHVSHTIVEAIVSMAGALGLDVVAEGVETEHQYEYLRGRGVSLMQGYLFHAPMSSTDLEQLVANARGDGHVSPNSAQTNSADGEGASAIRTLSRSKLAGQTPGAAPPPRHLTSDAQPVAGRY